MSRDDMVMLAMPHHFNDFIGLSHAKYGYRQTVVVGKMSCTNSLARVWCGLMNICMNNLTTVKLFILYFFFILMVYNTLHYCLIN